MALLARPPTEEKEAQRLATGVVEVGGYIIVLINEPAFRGRAVQVARFRVPAPATALRLSPLARHPLPGRFFAEPSRAAVERLVGAVGGAERSVSARAGLNVAAIGRRTLRGLLRSVSAVRGFRWIGCLPSVLLPRGSTGCLAQSFLL